MKKMFVFFALYLCFFFALTIACHAQEKELISPIISATIGRNPDAYGAILCVVTPPPYDAVEEAQWCTDFRNVHVYVHVHQKGAGLGTWASIRYHHGRYAFGPCETNFTDFITVYVQTQKEREQYLKSISEWTKLLYAPRDVPLE
jgi:hypothetical protein